ncbi:MAG: lysine--tRNA ligase [Candidatus Paceibacterota bacterium]
MTTIQAKHWADKIVQGIFKWQAKQAGPISLHVDDMKTPSGRVHTGSLRGAVLHDVVAQVLAANTSEKIINTYVFNDMDPMDGLPSYLDEKEYNKHMGEPLYKIPAPPLEQSGLNLNLMTAEEKTRFQNAKTFSDFYASDFIDAFRKIGCQQEIVWSHELYESGKMDEIIRLSLDGVEQIKQIYKQVADYDLPDKWFPFQVICPKCGKVGTTLVTDWDGSEVTFECQPNKVEWAQGCGYTGKISPFGGTGKLLWKVDWPAHWAVMGVTVEGAGKDHTSAGGSRDMGRAIVENVFGWRNPFDIPYEWILVRGAKMSSSKGVGTSAREFVRLFPPAIGRFLFVNKHYNQVIDFDPQDMSIPDLFDEFDQSARIFWGQEEGDQRLGRAFQLSQIGEVPQPHFLPRFRDLAVWMQHPELDLKEEFAKIKGSALSELELAVLEDRQTYARIWVDQYAPVEFQFTFKPEKNLTLELTAVEQEFLQAVGKLVESQTWQPADLQQALFNLAKPTIGAKQGFQAIYKAFLGKKSGPRAGWFLLNIPVEQRQAHLARLGGEK